MSQARKWIVMCPAGSPSELPDELIEISTPLGSMKLSANVLAQNLSKILTRSEVYCSLHNTNAYLYTSINGPDGLLSRIAKLEEQNAVLVRMIQSFVDVEAPDEKKT